MNRTPDLVRLRYFLAVANASSFRGASEALNIAQPAVSRAVQMLEGELGFKLLERTTRRVTLTEAGAILARDVEDAMQLISQSVRTARQVASGEAGELVIAYSAQAAHGPMADLIVRFRTKFPQARVSLYQMSSQEQIQAIESGRIDVGFLLSAACKGSVAHMAFAQERFVLLVSKRHPIAQRSEISLNDLVDVPFVVGTRKRWDTFRSLISSACLSAGFLPAIVEEADDVPVLLQLIALERGVTLYGSAIIPTLPPDITALPLCDTDACFGVSIAWSNRSQTPLIREFVSFVEQSRPQRPTEPKESSAER
ncbi:LysR family transcriptional regulator [Microvirga makkahensis]|uniref:LysR family transcriptional regulator n=1 Tax=Microvirga makkahensis TaxID=1128670 RepID=A0A7X3MP49_9HYPH|nr:LysR family transcriptional regulator [Microvirga makkahensis]MXQ10483.1 LysR family transcriptional regulator [Microvirga makkahensis]